MLQGKHNCLYKWKGDSRDSIRVMQREETQPLALNMEGNHEPRYVGSLSLLEKERKWILS